MQRLPPWSPHIEIREGSGSPERYGANLRVCSLPVDTVTKDQKLSGSPELPKGVRFLGTESRKGGVRAGSRGMGCCPLMGTVPFYKLRRTMKMGGGDGCTTPWIYSVPLKCTFKNGYNGKYICISPLKKKKQRNMQALPSLYFFCSQWHPNKSAVIKSWFEGSVTWAHSSPPLPVSCVISGRLLNLSESHLYPVKRIKPPTLQCRHAWCPVVPLLFTGSIGCSVFTNCHHTEQQTGVPDTHLHSTFLIPSLSCFDLGFAISTFATVLGSISTPSLGFFSFAEAAKRATFSLTPKMGKQTQPDPWEPTWSL